MDRILYKPDLRRDVQFIFSIKSEKNDENEVRFIASLIKKAAERNRVWASFSEELVSNDSASNRITINIIELRTKYPGFAKNKFLGTKKVWRNLSGRLKVQSEGTNYSYQSIDSIIVNYKDRVEYDDIDNIESNEYRFTAAKPPGISLWEEIVFPAAVITVSVAAALLFFIIRSK